MPFALLNRQGSFQRKNWLCFYSYELKSKVYTQLLLMCFYYFSNMKGNSSLADPDSLRVYAIKNQICRQINVNIFCAGYEQGIFSFHLSWQHNTSVIQPIPFLLRWIYILLYQQNNTRQQFLVPGANINYVPFEFYKSTQITNR